MEKKQIVNIVNFIRACEPRAEVDLVEPVREQLNLLKKHRLPGTFLLQYDALLEPRFTDLLQSQTAGNVEFGLWFEVMQCLVEKAGLVWRGRFPWDWHAHCGFSVGYTLGERERLLDIAFARFRDVFGYYPRSLGSWTIDAHTLAYAADKYSLDASCNCKDQWGTDGYTVWGGYYGQAYYPSRDNMFCPAQTRERQIDVPVFRMLGSDPLYQYDFGLSFSGGLSECQGVVTLEPVYTGTTGGGGRAVLGRLVFEREFQRRVPCVFLHAGRAGKLVRLAGHGQGADLSARSRRPLGRRGPRHRRDARRERAVV